MSLMKSVTYRLGMALICGWCTASPVAAVMASLTWSMYILPVCQMNCMSGFCRMTSRPAVRVRLMVRAPRLPPSIRIVFFGRVQAEVAYGFFVRNGMSEQVLADEVAGHDNLLCREELSMPS